MVDSGGARGVVGAGAATGCRTAGVWVVGSSEAEGVFAEGRISWPSSWGPLRSPRIAQATTKRPPAMMATRPPAIRAKLRGRGAVLRLVTEPGFETADDGVSAGVVRGFVVA